VVGFDEWKTVTARTLVPLASFRLWCQRFWVLLGFADS